MLVAQEVSIGVIKERIVTWINSEKREFEWGHVGMSVLIIGKTEGTFHQQYQIVDFGRASAPIVVPISTIEKIEVAWEQLR